MRIFSPARGPALRGVAVALVLAVAGGAAVAGPEDAPDPLLKLLADKGLLADKSVLADKAMPIEPTHAVEADTRPASLLRQVHDRASRLTVAAMDLVGVRYRRGGASIDTGFDCSGFTRHVFEMSLGLALPRRVDDQATAPGLVTVRRDDLRPGDLVFFNTLKRTFSHVGIYVGDNRFIHSPRTGSSVRSEDMSFAYWAKRFTGARRAEVAAAAVPSEEPPAPAAQSVGE
jgi:cell wall-associated NlpC family hydrolase